MTTKHETITTIHSISIIIIGITLFLSFIAHFQHRWEIKELEQRISRQEQQKFASFIRMHEERIRSLENSLSILKK